MCYNERMVKALEEAKAACEEMDLSCDGCPCSTIMGCCFNIGFAKSPEHWKLEKTYKEVITEIKF